MLVLSMGLQVVALGSAQPGAAPTLEISETRYREAVACFSRVLAVPGGRACLSSFDLDMVSLGEGAFRISGTTVEARRHGAFLIAPGGPPLAVLAPHTVSDLKTGDIGQSLFAGRGAQALLVGIVHRDGPRGSMKMGAIKERGFDLAHIDASLFQAWVEALASQPDAPLFVELHGFDATDDAPKEGAKARDYDLIIGAGDQPASAAAKHAVDALVELFGKERVGIYGENARTLGGTTNAQAKLLSRLLPGRFLHVEMALQLRTRLLADRKLMNAFRRAITPIATEPPACPATEPTPSPSPRS